MHNNFYFLRQLADELNGQLAGFTLVSCFTQNKDELVIEFNDSHRSFFIRASLLSSFSCLTFPATFSRARKNSLDLFLPLLMKKVESVQVFKNERSFQILFEEHHSLIFKMHGNRANVLFANKNVVIEIFRNHLKSDFEIVPDNLHREIDWSESTFKAHTDIFPIYFTLGKRVRAYLHQRGYDDLQVESQWVEMQTALRQLENPNGYYLVQFEGQYFLSLLKFGEVKKVFDQSIEAINEFFVSFIQTDVFANEKAQLTQRLKTKIKNSGSYLAKSNAKLAELKNDVHWQQWGDLLMANLHHAKLGMDRISVENFYQNNEPTDIPLKKELTPQRNAEVFYRKSKNQNIEIEKLGESILEKEKELQKVVEDLRKTEAITSLKELREISPEESSVREKSKAQPFHEFIFQGFKIWVGKDAQSNDELTLKHSYKEDLWLHAKDVPGSHVLIKHQAGKKIPKEVVERAAELAAYNSKRKTESLCPVAFTPKKFVRKRKGDPAGAVVVEREEVILVEPKLSR